jgi:hypothetical protein
MHQQSVTLLRKLKEELDGELRRYFGVGYLENESQLPFVGLYVVLVACGSRKAAEGRGLVAEGEGESKLLERAGDIFDGFASELE